ncbi:penicillin-binding protein 2 [Fusobacterium sp. MFO224]|uniref:penicillin-binding protein 2 n=1 Tax=Fusobacterium sp. MFO224 TaxID=3378070 RepID=UPI0038521D71
MKKSKFTVLGIDKSKRYALAKIFILVLFGILLIRLGYLQIYKGQEYEDKSINNRVRFIRKEAIRGNILDANGDIIATSKIGYRLNYLKERSTTPEIIKSISELTGYSENYIKKRIKYGEISMYTRRNILIEDLKEEEAHKIFEKIEEYPYLEIEMYYKRKYLYPNSASHLIGYVKKISNREYENLKDQGYSEKDIIGKEGVEKNYDSVLRGKKGYQYFEINARGIALKTIKQKPSEKGKDIQLTIDMRLQTFMENEFKKSKLTGSFIAINPKNGEILTMVSYPTYPLDIFSSSIPSDVWDKILYDKRKPLTNKSIAGEYPPGSVFKPIVAFGFMDEGLDPKEKNEGRNAIYSIGQWSWKSWKRGGHGPTDLKKSIIESVNTYYYKYGHKYGSKAITKAAKNFGLGEKTGIDISGEKSGVVPSPEWKKKKFKQGWYTGDTINYSIGQGYVTVTPIQIARAYCVLANKGYAYTPKVVKYIISDSDKEKIPSKKSLEVNYPNKFYDVMEDAMIGVVEDKHGTGKRLRTKNLKIAAKSGSAQNAHFKETHAEIAGYFPVKNPEIVFAVLLQGAGGGGSVAGALTKKFIDEYQFLYHGIKKEGENDKRKKN